MPTRPRTHGLVVFLRGYIAQGRVANRRGWLRVGIGTARYALRAGIVPLGVGGCTSGEWGNEPSAQGFASLPMASAAPVSPLLHWDSQVSQRTIRAAPCRAGQDPSPTLIGARGLNRCLCTGVRKSPNEPNGAALALPLNLATPAKALLLCRRSGAPGALG